MLPTLPAQWPEGSISGLCERGPSTVNLDWKDESLKRFLLVQIKEELYFR